MGEWFGRCVAAESVSGRVSVVILDVSTLRGRELARQRAAAKVSPPQEFDWILQVRWQMGRPHFWLMEHAYGPISIFIFAHALFHISFHRTEYGR